MRKTVVFLFVFSLVFTSTFSQKLKEKVVVTNVEMVVRAMRDGLPLGGLQKSDFRLLVNGKVKEINGFFEKRRRIGNLQEELSIAAPLQQKRMFLFYFWTLERLSGIQGKALDYFFENIFRPGDEAVLIGTGPPVIIQNKEEAIVKTKKFMQEFNGMRLRSTVDMQSDLMKKLTAAYNDADETMSNVPISAFIPSRIMGASSTNQRFVAQNLEYLKKIAKGLKSIRREKWAFVFMTMEPNVHLHNWLFPVGHQGGINEVNEEFVQSEATFNLFFFNSSLREMNTDIPFQVFTIPNKSDNVAEAFRHISKATGGQSLKGYRFEKSFERVTQREDIYYVLTYSPDATAGENALIDIRENPANVQVIYKSRVGMDESRGISIDRLFYFQGQLTFMLSDYELRFSQGQDTGYMKLKVEAIPVAGKSLLYEKEIVATEAQLEIGLKLNFPEKVTYKIVLKVEDLYAGGKTSESLDIQVE